MSPGDIVLTKHVTAAFSNAKMRGTVGYRAPKGGHLVLLFLGAEGPDTIMPIDPVRALYELGWSSPEWPDPREAVAPPLPGGTEGGTP